MIRFLRSTLPLRSALFLLLLTPVALLTGCGSYEVTGTDRCQVEPFPSGSQDLDLMERRGERSLLLALQEMRKTDPHGELTERGRIVRIPLQERGNPAPFPYGISERDEFPFHPYRIAYLSGGRWERLFVINRALSRNFSVELYDFRQNGLLFVQRIRSPLLADPTDLIALDKDEFLVSLRLRPSFPASLIPSLYEDRATLLHYNNGKWNVILRGVRGVEGMALSKDGSKLYLISSMSRSLHTYALIRDKGKLPVVAPLPGGVAALSGIPVSLTVDSAGDLYVGLHLNRRDLKRHARNRDLPAPSEIVHIHSSTGMVERFYGDGGKNLNALSSLVLYRNTILGGEIYDHGLLRCDLQK